MGVAKAHGPTQFVYALYVTVVLKIKSYWYEIIHENKMAFLVILACIMSFSSMLTEELVFRLVQFRHYLISDSNGKLPTDALSLNFFAGWCAYVITGTLCALFACNRHSPPPPCSQASCWPSVAG